MEISSDEDNKLNNNQLSFKTGGLSLNKRSGNMIKKNNQSESSSASEDMARNSDNLSVSSFSSKNHA